MAGAFPETLITTYLELKHLSAFKPAFLDDDTSICIQQMDIIDIQFYRFLYKEVGKHWRWHDRLLITDEALYEILDSPNSSIDILYIGGVPAGYIELVQQGQSTEVAYFGLRSTFFGRGLGKHLLSYGVTKAWQMGVSRVWLHTCNLDGPQALTNYLKRGFQIYDSIEEPMPNRYKSP